ncbi:hypothetical protein BJX61DRAFT_538649 [Aspergillus egyptiacus]|nr:hypothetical protein BJX61DRAFT_538649 [Aspergillus egyptiacus]
MGPTLPTTLLLALLALTSTSTTLAAPSLSRRYDLTCAAGGYYRPISEVQICIEYLSGLDSTACTVSSENQGLCTCGETVISGSPLVPGETVTSFCRDIATAAQKIVDSCQTEAGYVGGANAANGNGELIVKIHAG